MSLRSSAAILGAALAFACAAGGPDGGGPTATAPSNPPSPAPAPPPTAPPSPPPSSDRIEPPFNSDANFDIVDDSFVDENGDHDQEGSATIKVGQIVTWTQNGQNVHRVEFSKVPSNGNSADSGDLLPRRTFEFRPREVGEYLFFCRYHEYMMDVSITVEN